MSVIIDESHPDRLRERIAALENKGDREALLQQLRDVEHERDLADKVREEWRSAVLTEQAKVTQLVAENAALKQERDQLRAEVERLK